jgi:hypothetical protein
MRKSYLCLIASVLTTAATGVSAQSRMPSCPGSFNAATWTNCLGTFTWRDGAKYVGEFTDGKFNGQGTITYPNGYKYFGEWRNGSPNGQGTATFPNGERYAGEWKDGRLYAGEYKDGMPDG